MFSFILFLSLSIANPVHAQGKKKTLEQKVIQGNIKVSEEIDSLAERIDLFFAGERLTNEPNDSSLRFTYFAHEPEGEDFDDDVKVNFNLQLPNTEEDWKLRFTSEDDEEFEALDRRRAGAPPRRTRYGVSVGILKKLGDFDTIFRPGIKIRDPVETSYLLSFRNEVKIGKVNFTPRFDFFAESVRGAGQTVHLNFDYELNDDWALILLNEEQYLDLDNLFSTNHGPGVLYKVSDKISYASYLMIYSTNNPVFHLERYTLLFSRRQEIWRNILYFAVTPGWTWAKPRDWQPRADLSVSIDLIF